jgi:hypothetical protein
MRHLLVVTVSVFAALTVQPAGAAPVESSRAAVARMTLPGEDGAQWTLELRAISRASGASLAVAVSSCNPDCEPPRQYAGALPKGSLAIDGDAAKAHLDAVLGGLPVSVTWQPASDSGVVVGTLHGGGSDESMAFAVYNGSPATAEVRVRTTACRTAATVGDEHEVSTSPAGNTAALPLSRLRLRATGGPRCG